MSNDPSGRRQVIPDVDEGHEYFGYSAFGLMQVYTPALSTWFVGINLLPGIWTAISIVVGTVLFIGATIAVLASPSHETPGEYAKSVYNQHTRQPIKIHE